MRILLVEDNDLLARGVIEALSDDGHGVDWIADGCDADDFLRTEQVDLVLLDINLPGTSGLEILAAMRARRDETPILLLTARGEPDDRVDGLTGGADDYVVKPFHMPELLARIRALGRRRGSIQAQIANIGDLDYDRNSKRLNGPGGNIELSRRETALFETLLDHIGCITSKDSIADSLYGTGSDVDLNAIELLVSRLRRKLAGSKVEIRTARGLGYMLDADN